MKAENTSSRNRFAQKLNLRNKLILAMVSVGVVAIVATALISYTSTRATLRAEAEDALKVQLAIEACIKSWNDGTVEKV